ncbi:MAG: hypothetical protein HUU50_21655 [Candidatus Brocadiae bacterium]|nr:hypothetical protein [Candidatus Brocadiia bacterium]
MKNKIKILKISQKCYSQRGFDDRGCYGCKCDDSCCKYGADFDKTSYDLVIQYRHLIEPLIHQQIEKCFENNFSGDPEFLGQNSIRSLLGENGFCSFHKKNAKGCILYELALGKKIDKRIIPSICRLFPLSWFHGELLVYHEQPNAVIPHDCNCIETENSTFKNILETQKNEILDIFDLDPELLLQRPF